MSRKLKPCPFCGCEADTIMDSVEGPFNVKVTAFCMNPQCDARSVAQQFFPFEANEALNGRAIPLQIFIDRLHAARETAVNQWNQRTPCSQKPAESPTKA